MNSGFPSIEGIVPGSVKIKHWSFPARTDYERFFLSRNAITAADDLWKNPTLVTDVQRHWHSTGQNGCIFAQMIARSASANSWRHVVVSDFEHQMSDKIEIQLETALREDDCEILSLLFPHVTTVEEMVKTVGFILSVPSIHLAAKEMNETLVRLALRVKIPANGSLSWLMGFGPFTFFPKTRQAPILEVAIRVKAKPEKIFHRLNQDHTTAHLADYPIEMSEEKMERTWVATEKNTRDVLGQNPDEYSAAKVTFTIPRDYWHTPS